MSGKHKRDRAAEHKAKLDAKEAKRIAEAWSKPLGLGEPYAQSVARRGGVVHGDGIGRWVASASTGEIATLMIPPRAGKQALIDKTIRTLDYGASKYSGPVYSSVVEHMNASHVRFVNSADELEDLGFDTRSEVYEQAQSLFEIDPETRRQWTGSIDDSSMREWFADPDLGSPMFNNSPGAEAYTWRDRDASSIIEDMAALARTLENPRLPDIALMPLIPVPTPVLADPEYRFFQRQLETIGGETYAFGSFLGPGYVNNKIVAPRRPRSMTGFTGVGALRLGAQLLNRAMVSEAHFKIARCRDARAIGNRHDFKRWVRNELAPVVRFAHDSAAEMAAAGATLEGHTIALYNTEDITRRRELEMFIAEAIAARANARRRTLAALLEVVTLDVAIAWSRPAETLGEQGRRRLEEQHARKWVSYPRSPARMERLTTSNARIDHVSIAPGGGISVGYTVR